MFVNVNARPPRSDRGLCRRSLGLRISRSTPRKSRDATGGAILRLSCFAAPSLLRRAVEPSSSSRRSRAGLYRISIRTSTRDFAVPSTSLSLSVHRTTDIYLYAYTLFYTYVRFSLDRKIGNRPEEPGVASTRNDSAVFLHRDTSALVFATVRYCVVNNNCEVGKKNFSIW